MSLPYAYNPLLMNPGVTPASTGLMPLRFLIRQAGVAGCLLLLENPLGFATIRRRADGYDSVDTSAMIQVLYAVICVIYAGWYLASPKNRGASRILRTNPLVFLVLYIVLCTVSALWSPKPLYTAFMAFQCLAFLLLVVAALSELSRRCAPQDAIEWVMLWIVWTILWSVILQVSRFGLSYLVYPFGAARLASGLFFFLGLYLCKRRYFGWLVVAFGVLSLSNKNYFGIVPGLLFAAWLGDKKAKVLAFGFAGLIAISVLLFGAEEVVQSTLFYGKEGVGWDYTSGRDKIFALAWNFAMERSMIGYGFVAGERDILLETYRGAISTHNAFLSAFLAVGFLGPVLLLLYLLGTLKLCLSKTIPPSWRFAYTATLFVVLVVSMTAPGLGGRVYGAWLPSVVVMTMIAVLCRNSGLSHVPFLMNPAASRSEAPSNGIAGRVSVIPQLCDRSARNRPRMA